MALIGLYQKLFQVSSLSFYVPVLKPFSLHFYSCFMCLITSCFRPLYLACIGSLISYLISTFPLPFISPDFVPCCDTPAIGFNRTFFAAFLIRASISLFRHLSVPFLYLPFSLYFACTDEPFFCVIFAFPLPSSMPIFCVHWIPFFLPASTFSSAFF